VEEKDVLQSIINQFMKSTNMSKTQIPMRRFATPKEIADVVLFLLGPASSYITVSDVCIVCISSKIPVLIGVLKITRALVYP
jgi:NAD(P)-dependent dehydrogenase (short-subunit alcohol dehydrogenase family)